MYDISIYVNARTSQLTLSGENESGKGLIRAKIQPHLAKQILVLNNIPDSRYQVWFHLM